MKRRILASLLTLVMMLSLLPTALAAEENGTDPAPATSGEVCSGITWTYDAGSKTLTVSGSGLITLDDTSGNTHPWDAFKAEIEHLVIGDDITGTDSIKVFADLSALQTVQFPDSLTKLATGTFATDTALSSVVLPKTIESIGSVVFSMCTGLTSLTIQNRTMTVPAEECWSSDNRKAPDGLTVYGYKWKSDNKTNDNLTDFYRYVQWQNKNNGGSIQFVALDDTEAAKGGLIKNAVGSDSQIYWAFNEDTKTLTVSGTGDINWDDSENCYKGGENPPWNDYKSQIENLVIGEGITGTSRIKIFANLANLKNIQFPATFTKLYSGAFASCWGLESVTLPEQLVSMGDVVFSNCTNLKTLVVKNRALKTPTSGNWSTGSFPTDQPGNNLPTNLTVYGYHYTDDTKETETTLYQYVKWQNTGRPKGDTQKINFVAFDDDTSASSGLIVGSNNILWVFDKNTKTLTVSGEGNITWDAKLYKAGDNPPWATFIPQIEKLVIGEGITGSSETKLFANLTCLKQISFPSTFTSMGDGTFATASALENVVIPATVTKMGPVVFSACDNLKSLTVLNRTMQITNAESDWTTAGRPAPQNLTVYGYRWKSDDEKNDENLTDIYKYVQYNNQKGGKITFVAQDESDWMPIDATGISWRYDAATKTLYLMGSGEIKLVGDQYKAGDNPPWSAHFSQVENLVIGEGITGTGTLKIFSSLTKLQNVSFPSTFKKLDTGTFATCSSLERIVLPETISSMGSVVFSRCNAMTSLVVKNRNLSVPVETEWSSDKTIPQNLTVYGYRYTDDTRATETKLYQYVQWQNKNYSGTINFVAFDDPNATAGQIGNSDTYWRYDPNTTTLFITGKGMIPGGSSGNYPWQAYADEITNLVIGDGVTGTEATKALAELYKLRSITFGNDFAILGAGAFANIQTLTQLTLPETITTFGSYPFSGCNGMTELRVECRNIQVADVNSYWNGSAEQALPKNLTVYGYRYTAKGSNEETAFYKYITNEKNKNIKFVDLDDEAKLLGDIRWNYDSSAKKLTISGKGEIPAVSGGTAWNRYASEIEEIEIEKGVTSIAAGAFTGMTELKTVTIHRTVTNIAAGAFDTPYSFTIKAKRNSAAKTFAKANNINFEEIVTANILFIGNSYTEDAREYLRYVFNQYDFQADIHFGHLFSGGKTLAYYANTARQETNNSNVYGNGALDTESPRSQETGEGGNTYTNSLTYYTWDNNQTTFASQGTKSIAYAMNDQDWDIVIIQGHDIEQAYGDKSNANFATNLEYLTNYIKSFDPTVEIGWYMTWRRNGGEGLVRLQAYWETMQKTVATNKNVSFIVPIGTAVENARGTYINQFNYRPESQSNIAKVNLLTGQSIGSTMTPDNNNGTQRDETHMSAVVGRFLAGYTMGEMLVKHINGLGGAQFTKKTAIEQIYSYDPNIGLLPAEYVQTIKACADAAMASPYIVTQLTDHKTDPVQAVKSLVEAADFTNTEWNKTTIKAKAEAVLAEKKKTGAKVTSVSVSDSTATITLRYGYSTATAEITYSPDAGAAQWTAHIESTKLGSTTVPGSDMKYSEVPAIQAALAKGYSDIWAAKTAEAANAALEASKENLLKTVKEYVKYLADTVYNNGAPTELNGNSYTVSKETYGAAVNAIDSANNVSGVLDAYDAMLDTQVCRTISSVSIMPDKESMVGSSTVTLTITKAPTDAVVSVTCDDSTVAVKDNGGGTYTVFLPNITKTYTFTASIEQSDTYTAASTSCTVSVTRKSSGGSSSSSGSSGSYAVSVPSAKNGDVTVSPKNASKGDRVTITVTPDKGYELDKLTVKDASGNKLKLTDKGNGKYTFTMPGSKVTVSAEFVEEQATSTFADVPADAYYAKAVEWAVKKGITNGKANGLFGSNDPCTRGQIVTFLWRAAGSPAPKGTVKVPSDVLPGSYCYDAVAWALENGITNGLADGTFGVNSTCTRGQSVTFLYRAMGTAPTTVNGFTDVESNAFCAEAVAWAVENGVTNGTSATTFSPNAGCTRAQIVTFLFRTYQGK